MPFYGCATSTIRLKRDMLLIDIRSLKIGHHEFNLTPSPEEAGLDPELFRDLRVDVGMDYDGKKAFVGIDCSAVASLLCDRTLESFERPVKGSYSVLFSPAEQDEANEEGVRTLEATDEEIDITDIVRDTILLAVPVRKIAPGAEEVAVPTAFGAPSDSSIDPRWEALRALKEQSE